MKTVNLYLTNEEIQNGCQKSILMPNQVTPFPVVICSGSVKNGTEMIVNDVGFYGDNGKIFKCAVKINIVVKNGEHSNANLKSRPKKLGFFTIFLASLFGKRSDESIVKCWIRRIVTIAVVLFAVGYCIATPHKNKPSRETANTIPPVLADAIQDMLESDSAGEKQTSVPFEGNGTVVSPNYNSTNITIPVELRMNNWDGVRGEPKYCPRFVFYSDGSCDMWLNFWDGYFKVTSTYQVYGYGSGLRTIVLDTSGIYLDNRLATDAFLVEHLDRTWTYYGDMLGCTENCTSFSKNGENTIPVFVEDVYIPSFSEYGHNLGSQDGDDITVHSFDGGLVYFSFGIYRMLGYENQAAVSISDKTAYCFLSSYEDFGQSDGFVELTFSEHDVALKILSASADSGYLQDYVGETIIFNVE